MQITKTLADGLDFLGWLLSKPDEAGHWTEPELIAYLNAAQKDITPKIPSSLLGPTLASKDEFNPQTKPFSLGTEYINMPSTFIKFLSGYRFIWTGAETQRRLFIRQSVEYINSIKVHSNYSSQMIRSAYIAEYGSQFYIYPPTIANEGVNIFFVRTPIPLTTSTTLFSVIDDLFEIVCCYAAFLACLKDKQARAGDFLTMVNSKIVELNAIHGTVMPLLTQPK